jgi:hypothetical protein
LEFLVQRQMSQLQHRGDEEHNTVGKEKNEFGTRF